MNVNVSPLRKSPRLKNKVSNEKASETLKISSFKIKRKNEALVNQSSKVTKIEITNMSGKVQNIKKKFENKKSSPEKKLSFVQQQIKNINDKSKP